MLADLDPLTLASSVPCFYVEGLETIPIFTVGFLSTEQCRNIMQEISVGFPEQLVGLPNESYSFCLVLGAGKLGVAKFCVSYLVTL